MSSEIGFGSLVDELRNVPGWGCGVWPSGGRVAEVVRNSSERERTEGGSASPAKATGREEGGCVGSVVAVCL